MGTTAKQRLTFILIIAGLVLGIAVLYWFPPERYRLYPRCLFYSATGLQCPGCGGLRAAHQLLHGRLLAAFQLNPMVMVLLPVAALLLVAHGLKRVTGRDWVRPFRHRFWLWLLVGGVIAFGVARNLPFSPFTYFIN